MKEISLFTRTKITADKVAAKIIDSYKWKMRIVQNDETEIFLGYSPYEFYIVFSDSCDINDPDCLFEESDKKQIPFDNPQVNEIYFHDDEVAKYVISVILTEYPELYLMDDDGNVFSASSFIAN